MNWQEFEDRLACEADAHPMPVDTDALWAKIREKRRRRWLPFFWLLGAGLLIGGGLLVRAYIAWQTPAHSGKTPAETHKTTTNASRQPAASDGKSGSSEYAPAVGQINLESKSFPNAHPALHTASPKAGPSLYPSLATVSNPPQDTVLPSTQARQTVKVNSERQLKRPGSIDGRGTSQTTLDTLPAPVQKNMDSSQSVQAQPSAAALAFRFSLSGSPQPVALPFLVHPFLPLIPPLPEHPTPLAIPPAAPAVKKANPLYVGLQTGLATWRLRTDSLPTHRQGEKTLAALQIGLQAQLPLGQHWSLRTGVQYTQYQSVFRWTKTWTVSDSAMPVPILNYYVNGDIDTTYGAGVYYYAREVQHYNRLQSIAVPLDLHYRLALGTWSLKPFAGVQLQVWQRADGVILKDEAPDNQAYRAIYRPVLNLGLHFGLSLEAPLGPKTRVFVEPAGLMDVIRRTGDEYPAERFQQWGVHVGVLRQW